MIHHDQREYAVAVADSAAKFQEKLENMVSAAKPRIMNVIEQVENDIPEDYLVQGKKLRFNPTTSGISIELPENDKALAPLDIHDHAFGQIVARVGDKFKFRNAIGFLNSVRNNMPNGEGDAAAAEFLNRAYSKLNGDRFLVRSVKGQLRGFLSDSYRRLDSRPLLEAFMGSIKQYGARPLDGFALQTKVNIRAIIPQVYQPFPGEIMAFGAQLSDSDFGDGALSVSGFVLRMVCTNLATTEDVLKQIHLGRRMSNSVHFSQHTVDLDTKAFASAINDVAGHVLGEGARENYLAMVKKANKEKIEPSQIKKWAKEHLGQDETKLAEEKFNSPDIEMLPAGQTKWRWSNALSWLANETENEHRKLELQEFAGDLLK